MPADATEAIDFCPHFSGRLALATRDSPMMQSVYELRYQVYCLECGFLPAEDYPTKQESDEFDSESAHFCSYNSKDELVGYVRLVSAARYGRFPFELQGASLFPEFIRPDPDDAAEISRLMVRSDYRRRSSDLVAGISTDTESAPLVERRSASPQILLCLYRQMYQHSLANGTRFWYAAMERSLARALTRLSFSFTQVGPEVDYYGPVAPYLADLRELEDRLAKANPALMAWMQKPEKVHG